MSAIAPPRVLIIDDDPVFRRLLRQHVSVSDAQRLGADSGVPPGRDQDDVRRRIGSLAAGSGAIQLEYDIVSRLKHPLDDAVTYSRQRGREV